MTRLGGASCMCHDTQATVLRMSVTTPRRRSVINGVLLFVLAANAAVWTVGAATGGGILARIGVACAAVALGTAVAARIARRSR